MFILAAVLIISGIVLVFNVLGSPAITEEKKFQDTRMLDKTAENIMREYMFALGTATLYPKPNESASNFISDLSSYMRNETDSSIFYAIIFVNGTNQRYSVNIGNYMDDSISVNVSATNSTPASGAFALNDKKNTTLYFSSGINGTVNVTVSYTKGNNQITENIRVGVSTKNLMQGLFDITVRDSGFSVNLKETYNRTW